MPPHATAESRTSSNRVLIAVSMSLAIAAQASGAVTAWRSTPPLTFEANEGQTDPRVKFLARGSGYNIFFTPGEVVMSRSGQDQRADVVRMSFAGANKRVRLTGTDPQTGKTNYFLGNDPARWHRDVTNYAKVKYAGIYPGIDLVYYGNQRQLEYDIVVSPGANPKRIALAFGGVKALSIDPDGNLVLETSIGTIVQQKPLIYQITGSSREPVAGQYVLLAGKRVGFSIAGYDKSRPLIIDPVLAYSTFLGGSTNDIGRAIAFDSAGNSYVTGETNSVNFPGASSSAIQSAKAGIPDSYDVFVAKLNPSGTALVYTTYLGGSGGDFGWAIAVDGAGNAYITGETSSPTAAGPGNSPFPLAVPFDPSYNLGGDAFITKINAAGNALVYSTYFGGTGGERGYGIAVDSSGSAYVTGSTNSTGATGLPVVAGAVQPLNGGNYDAFVAKINAAGSALDYSTYLGGTLSEFSDEGGGIAIDTAGNAYVAGRTSSTNFPGASASTIQPTHGGDLYDGYVAKLNANGSALIYSTYLGGSGRESVNGIAIDSANNVYVTGNTDSINFPTASALQPARAGTGNDAFVAKINAAGDALSYSTYLGSPQGDIAFAIAVDGIGNVYVSGWTDSPTSFPTVSSIQSVNGGTGDMFVSALNTAGSALIYSTYFGGAGNEFGYGIAVDGAGNAYVTGSTNSTNFTTGALQPMLGGSLDAFVVAIAGPGPVAPTGLTATATTLTEIALSWNASPGATQYEIQRTSGGGYATLITIATTNYADTTATATTTYVYRVRALDSLAQPSPFSAPDAATTIFFSDDPLIAQVTEVRRTHIVQLRQAVNAMRTTANLGTVFTDGNLNGLPIKATHVQEIRDQLAGARTTLGLSTITNTDTLVAGTTVVKAVHVQELRTGVK